MTIYFTHTVRRTTPRLTLIAIGVLQLCSAGPALAAAAPDSDARAIDIVVVSSGRASMRRALAAQEKADNIVSVISSDDIGGLPDKNAAEALARLPGVALQRDQGEGRYIVVRGMGPDYNAVTINGALVPSPESGRRAVALDVLPAGLVRSLEVSKTLMPDQDANSLGGTVEVKSLSAFDLPGRVLSLQAGASHDKNTGKTSPSASVLAAARFMDGKLGVAAGLSGEKRRFGSDNVETGGGWEDGKLTHLEMRNYLPQRERHALAVNLDYRPQAGQSYYLRSFLSRFSDDEMRDRLTITNISSSNINNTKISNTNISDDGATPGTPFSARGERRLRQRKYTQQISSIALGGEQRIDAWKLSGAATASRAGEDTPESINDARFRGATDFTGLTFSGTEVPRLLGPASLSDPASYKLRSITLQARDSNDAEHSVRIDLGRQLALGSVQGDIKGGVKFSRRDKDSNTEQWGYSSSKTASGNYWGAGSVSMSDFVGGVLDYPFAQLGPGINPALIRARVAGLPRGAARLAVGSTEDDLALSEDIDAAYLQSGVDLGNWRVLAGLRNERTSFRARGNRVSEDGAEPVSSRNAYSSWLPNLQLRYEIDARTSVRAAWTNSVVRANFSQLAPGITLDSDTEAVIGNPRLKPLTSSNIDLGIERMLGADGALSVYLYAKKIKDFTYTTDLAGTGVWTGFDVATSYANGERSRVRGIELAYSHALRKLPAPWNGLIVGANASFNKATATIGRFDIDSARYLERSIRLPGQSKQLVNLMLGYESGNISTRLALNHKSNYLLELGGDILDPQADAYVDSQRQLDFSFGYKISKSAQLVFEGVNLNHEKYYVYQGSKPFNTQFEQYGRTFKLSLKANLL